MKNKIVALYGLIIASYAAVSLLLGSFSFGMMQIRIAEVLLVMCLYDKKYILPITLACFVTNLIGIMNGLNPLFMDLIVGTLATFLSAICVYVFRNMKIFNLPVLSLFFPAIINGLLVGLELAFYYSLNFGVLVFYVGIGEFIAVTIFGLILYKPIGKVIEQYME